MQNILVSSVPKILHLREQQNKFIPVTGRGGA
jgi:hypothetical protein